MSQKGGGLKKTEMSQFRFGNFENRNKNVPISIWKFWKQRGGSLFFKNVPISIIFAIFCNFAFIKNVWNSKMSQFGQKGGGSTFFKNVPNSKMSQRSEGGVNPNWDIVPNVLDFLFWCLPLKSAPYCWVVLDSDKCIE